MTKAIISKIQVSEHPNADRLQIGTVCFENVVVGLNVKSGDLGIYFPPESQIGPEFAEKNNLIRKKDPETGANIGGLFDENRRVRVQKIRGVKSDGFWCPMSYLDKLGDTSKLKVGDQISTFNKLEICKKYLPKRNPRSMNSGTPKNKKTYRNFPEHEDTKQLKYNLGHIKVGDELIILLKKHGTSQRSANCAVVRDLKWYEKLLIKCGIKIQTEEMQVLNGTRRVVLNKPKDGFHCPNLREKHFNRIKDFIEPHMVVYYEVVGWESPDKTIMPIHDCSKYKDIKKQYGNSVTYSYGLPKGESEIYVYRIAYVLPNGKTIDLSWDEVKQKCNLWGVNHVLELDTIKYVDHTPQNKNEFDSIDDIVSYIDQLSDGPDPIDPRHPIEGVCVRINKAGWSCFKNKGWTFKLLEGIAKLDDDYLDPEEES